MSKNNSKLVTFGKKLLNWAHVPMVLDGLGFGAQTTRVVTDQHPGGLWALETGSTVLVDVSGNPDSSQTLDRLRKLRRSIALYTALVVTLGIITLISFMMVSSAAGLWLVATLVSSIFLASKVAAHEESRHHVVEISTDATAIRNGIAGDEAKEAAQAGSELVHVLRQFANNEALLPTPVKKDLITRASSALRPELPFVTASSITDVTQDIRQALGYVNRSE